MKLFLFNYLVLTLIWLGLITGLPLLSHGSTSAKYIILFQGDGMGAEHIKAGGIFVNGASGTLIFESFPYQTTMTHNNASNQTTDSAASASAMATGVKVNNGVVSVALPGDGHDLPSLLERYQGLGKHVGLITTSYLTDASPACHGAHVAARSDYTGIFSDFINQSHPNVIFGGGGYGFDTTMAMNNSYNVVTDRAALLALDPDLHTYIAGSFGTGYMPAEGMVGRDSTLPTLAEMTIQALDNLENNPNGFYLFIEHEGTDEYGHANNIEGVVKSMKELNNAINQALTWIDNPSNDSTWSNTLIMVLADHETGNLLVTETNPQPDMLPAITWTTTGHSQTPVNIYAKGVDANQITGVLIDNTDMFTFLGPSSPLPTATSTVTTIATPISTATPVIPPLPSTTSTPSQLVAMDNRQILAYPNPSQGQINFSFNLSQASHIKIVLYNLSGDKIVTLNNYLNAGPATAVLTSGCLSPGLYLAKVIVNDQEWKQLKISIIH